MTTPRHSTQRLRLIAAISLFILAAVTSLWRLQLGAAPSAAADTIAHLELTAADRGLVSNPFGVEPPNAAKMQTNQDTTAILFLIDESGGVSGRCGVVDSSNVFVTDVEGRRYELVRFYLQLWRAYYQFLVDEDDSEFIPRPISLGIMQFARDVPPAFQEIKPIEELLGPQGFDRFGKLQSSDGMNPAVDANWYCGTDFTSALDRAAEELNRSEAKQKILVLLTDGSTRGNESEFENENKRSATRQSIENALRRQQNSEIRVLTVMWRHDECVEENNCGLTSPNGEFELRRDDLARWENWERAGLLTLIDDEQAIKALAETPSFSPLLPGVGQFATGWIDGTTDQTTERFFSEIARLLKVVVITSDGINQSEIHFVPRSISGGITTPFAELIFNLHEPQWYWAEKDIPGSSAICPQRELEIGISEPVLAYYWLPFEQDWPKIKSVSVEPQETTIDSLSAGAIPSEDREIEVTVEMEPIDMNHYNCFQVKVTVGSEPYFEKLSSNNSTLQFPPIILKEDLVYGRTPITATLVFANEPAVSSGAERSAGFNIVFEPIFPERIDVSVTETESFMVTVPITFSAQIPGFKPKFGLFPDRFDPFSASPPSATSPGPNGSPEEENCPATQPLDRVLESSSSTITSDPVSEFVTNYVVAFPRHAIQRCGYKYLLAMWASSDKEGYTWTELADMGPNTVEPTTTPVTPTPPPQEPPVNQGLPNWVVLTFFGVIALIVFLVWHRSKA